MDKCVFVIDVQKGFLSTNTEYIVERIKELLEQNIFDLVIMTKFINDDYTPYSTILRWNGLKCTEEQQIDERIKNIDATIIEKRIYTAINEEVLSLLTKYNIKKAFVLGVDTDCCVMKTAVDLFEKNIHPYVLSYYCASNGGKVSHESGIRVLERLIGKNNIIHEKVNRENIDNLMKSVIS